VLSPLLKQDPKGTETLRRWIQSECMWVRRAALVTLVPLTRRGEHLDLSYELAEAALGEQADLMHKAVGWLLREAGKTNPERLERFLLRHHGAIPRTSVRYAIERFPEAERKRLLQQTRGSATAHPQPTLRSE
jgi:3-methyladenine DNA glycosylase AlkD